MLCFYVAYFFAENYCEMKKRQKKKRLKGLKSFANAWMNLLGPPSLNKYIKINNHDCDPIRPVYNEEF